MRPIRAGGTRLFRSSALIPNFLLIIEPFKQVCRRKRRSEGKSEAIKFCVVAVTAANDMKLNAENLYKRLEVVEETKGFFHLYL
jgi:hypothetical protein